MLLVGGASTALFAQSASVESKAYGVMLNTLLSHSVPEISVSELAKQQGQYLLLDAREAEEYSVSGIAGARPVGYDHFDMEVLSDVPKDQPIIVYCSVGYRSEKVSEQLLAAGYQTVYNLYGGIFEWKNQGQEVVTPSGEATQRVHAYSRSWGIWLKKGKKVY